MPSLAQFSDVAKVLETFIARGSQPLVLEFKNRGAAVNWRQRAYTYRTALRRTLKGASPYDDLILRLAEKDSPKPNTITILLRPFEAKIMDSDGNPIELISAPIDLPPDHVDPESDPELQSLLDQATRFRSKLLE